MTIQASDFEQVQLEPWPEWINEEGWRLCGRPGQSLDDLVTEINKAPPVIVAVPASVSSRQFKLQLLAAGLLDQVDAWISSQSKAVQIAYEYSGSFVRTEPMMAAGFAAMGFTDQQIDDFFTAAAAL